MVARALFKYFYINIKILAKTGYIGGVLKEEIADISLTEREDTNNKIKGLNKELEKNNKILSELLELEQQKKDSKAREM